MPEAPTRPQTRILLIDDDAAFHRFLCSLLEADRVDLEWRANGRDGLAAFQPRCFDLVVVDYQLPDMLGTEILDNLHLRDARTPVVMFTGYGTVDVAVEAMKRGAVDFFTKPLADPASFIRFLNRTLRLELPLPLPPDALSPSAGDVPGAGQGAPGAGQGVPGVGSGGSAGIRGAAAHGTPDGGGGFAAGAGSAAALGAGGRAAGAGAEKHPNVEAAQIRDLCARLEPPVTLSNRECEVVAALLRGEANKEIAKRLFISDRTVKNHLTHIYGKFGVETRAHLFNLILTHLK
jgi:FixJ family two-component response regulator